MPVEFAANARRLVRDEPEQHGCKSSSIRRARDKFVLATPTAFSDRTNDAARSISSTSAQNNAPTDFIRLLTVPHGRRKFHALAGLAMQPVRMVDALHLPG